MGKEVWEVGSWVDLNFFAVDLCWAVWPGAEPTSSRRLAHDGKGTVGSQSPVNSKCS